MIQGLLWVYLVGAKLQSPFGTCGWAGVRLAKRHDALSLWTLRQQGITPEMVRERMQAGG
jgi:hypothetical protein